MKKSFQISSSLTSTPLSVKIGAEGKRVWPIISTHLFASLCRDLGLEKRQWFYTFSPLVRSSTLHGCRLCSLCIWLHKHNQYGRGELFYDWRSCCVFGGEIHYLVSEPSAIQYHLFIKSLFARRKWIQLQQPRERERGRQRRKKRREGLWGGGGVGGGSGGCWMDWWYWSGTSWNRGALFFHDWQIKRSRGPWTPHSCLASRGRLQLAAEAERGGIAPNPVCLLWKKKNHRRKKKAEELLSVFVWSFVEAVRLWTEQMLTNVEAAAKKNKRKKKNVKQKKCLHSVKVWKCCFVEMYGTI